MKLIIIQLFLFLIAIQVLTNCSQQQTHVRDGFIEVEQNLRLHYRITGSGKDTIVVPDGGWLFPYIEKNGTNQTFIVYDVRNRGYSDSVERPDLIRMEYEISDLEKVRQFFNLKQMKLIGWSYLGGMVALYAVEYPEFVHSIIQVGPIPIRKGKHWDSYGQSIIERGDSILENKIELMKTEGIDKSDPQLYCKEYWKAFILRIIANRQMADQFAMNVPCNCQNEWPQNISVGNIISGLGNWDWTDQIKSITARALLIHGIKDNIPTESSMDWLATIPNSRLLILKSSGHLPFAEEPDDFFRAIDKFTKGGWPDQSTTFN